MADKMTFMGKWLKDIENDKNLDLSKQELAYITYAAVVYGISGETINIGAIFGNEFKNLNLCMSNIYGQIDNIQKYDPGRKCNYDSDAIKELRLQGLTAKEICEKLGYPQDKSNSLTSNKGWIEAGNILKQKNTESVQNIDENTESVQIDFRF